MKDKHKPTEKNLHIDRFITSVTGVDRKEVIVSSDCVFGCSPANTNFRNEISKREYRISGMCQDCQDKFFGKD